MKAILAAPQRSVLEGLARKRTLLAFDFDGTLAPLNPVPGRAQVRPETRLLLHRLTRLYPCVVLTGRARPDARSRLKGLGFREVMGSHGLEPWSAGPKLARRIRSWRESLSKELEGVAGVVVEDKRYALAVHYRGAVNRRRAEARVLEAAARLPGARPVLGVVAVNILPLDAPDRGDALLLARERFACTAALYAGDEEADEDVFARSHSTRLVSIRVGRRPASQASYYVPNQRSIDSLLERLCALRTDPL